MNHQLLDALLDDDTAWCWSDTEEHGTEPMDAAAQVRHAAAAASA
jgi:hypothetical protein